MPIAKRLTSLQRLVLAQHPGKSWEQLLTETYNQHGSLEGAARALGVSRDGFRLWMEQAGFRIERVFRAVPVEPAERAP